jgi:hypothetical protein
MTISIVNGVNPLQTTLLELGIVSIRVALLLRCAEIQPVFGRFVLNGLSILPPSTGAAVLPGGFVRKQGASSAASALSTRPPPVAPR